MKTPFATTSSSAFQVARPAGVQSESSELTALKVTTPAHSGAAKNSMHFARNVSENEKVRRKLAK